MNRQRTVRPVERECGLPKIAAAGVSAERPYGLPTALIERPPPPRWARGERRGEDARRDREGPKVRPGACETSGRTGKRKTRDGLIHPAREARARKRRSCAHVPPQAHAQDRRPIPSPGSASCRRSCATIRNRSPGRRRSSNTIRPCATSTAGWSTITTCTKPARLIAAAAPAAAPAASCCATTRPCRSCAKHVFPSCARRLRERQAEADMSPESRL